jgi:hypothetical protein
VNLFFISFYLKLITTKLLINYIERFFMKKVGMR